MLAAQGTVLTNKYAEGYPGKRYYGGCEFVDVVEELAIERAKQLFGADYANVQPHSGSQANAAVYLALLEPGDTVLGMSLDHGGHLTHGAKVNFSGSCSTPSVRPRSATGEIDYAQVERLAREHRPKMIIAGFSRLLARDRLAALPRDRGRGRCVLRGRHGARRGPGRRRRVPEPGAVRRCRDDHDAQDAARPARRADPRANERGSCTRNSTRRYSRARRAGR